MKQTLLTFIALLLTATGFSACAQNKKGDNTMKDKKTLVAYFSWSGNTAEAAKYIAQKTGADLFEIVREADYPTDYDECANEAKTEKDANIHPTIRGKVENMEQYDVVFVCMPVWWYTAPMPVFTFLEQYDFGGKTVIPFCTAYTAEYETLKDIVAATPKSEHRDGICVVTKEMGGKGMDRKHGEIDKWLAGIRF